jgi:hypothetical protein
MLLTSILTINTFRVLPTLAIPKTETKFGIISGTKTIETKTNYGNALIRYYSTNHVDAGITQPEVENEGNYATVDEAVEAIQKRNESQEIVVNV